MCAWNLDMKEAVRPVPGTMCTLISTNVHIHQSHIHYICIAVGQANHKSIRAGDLLKQALTLAPSDPIVNLTTGIFFLQVGMLYAIYTYIHICTT